MEISKANKSTLLLLTPLICMLDIFFTNIHDIEAEGSSDRVYFELREDNI